MARVYHVEIAAIVSQADTKWVDNLLSHFDLPGVDAAKQGVARKISVAGVRQIALVRQLCRDLGLPLRSAIDLAGRLLTVEGGVASYPPHLTVALDRSGFSEMIDARLAEAAETTTPARRGRRPRRVARHRNIGLGPSEAAG